MWEGWDKFITGWVLFHRTKIFFGHCLAVMPLPHLLWAAFSWIVKLYALLLVFVRVTEASLERRWYFVNRSWDALIVLSREIIKLASRRSSGSNYGLLESLNSWVLSLALGFTYLPGPWNENVCSPSSCRGCLLRMLLQHCGSSWKR